MKHEELWKELDDLFKSKLIHKWDDSFRVGDRAMYKFNVDSGNWKYAIQFCYGETGLYMVYLWQYEDESCVKERSITVDEEDSTIMHQIIDLLT